MWKLTLVHSLHDLGVFTFLWKRCRSALPPPQLYLRKSPKSSLPQTRPAWPSPQAEGQEEVPEPPPADAPTARLPPQHPPLAGALGSPGHCALTLAWQSHSLWTGMLPREGSRGAGRSKSELRLKVCPCRSEEEPMCAFNLGSGRATPDHPSKRDVIWRLFC